MLFLFLAKSQMKRINVTVCARTDEYGANHGPISFSLQLYTVAKQLSVVNSNYRLCKQLFTLAPWLDLFDFAEGDFGSDQLLYLFR